MNLIISVIFDAIKKQVAKHYFHLFIIGLIVLLMAGCRQRAKIKLAGVVKHEFTHAPISNIYIELAKHTRKPWPILDWQDWVISTHSDAKGNYSFDVDVLQRNESYIIRTYFPYDDTVNIGWKYSSPEITIGAEDSIRDLTLSAFPEGEITLNISDSTWKKINVDTLYLSTPYDTSVALLRGYFESFKCWMEPSQENRFDFWYFKKGKKTSWSKRVYVPCHQQPKELGLHKDINYEIEL